MKEARITKENGFVLQDIKTEKITATQLDSMKKMAGGYEALFNRRAIKYKEIKGKTLTEADYRKYILLEYTFLKRPVVIINQQIFIGNGKNNITNLIKVVANHK